MKKPKYLYHGSSVKLDGEYLNPKQADDLGKRSENLHNAVYATDIKEIAIAMAIISSEGVISASLKFDREPYGIIYEGDIKQGSIYLYTLPSENFEQSKVNEYSNHQWHSFEPVKPLKIEILAVKDYTHLIRKATPEEVKKFIEKYGK